MGPPLRPRARRSSWHAAARWLPLLLVPFAFGVDAAIFPLDKVLAVSTALAVCAAQASAGLLAPKLRPLGPLGGWVLLGFVFSLPLWCLASRDEAVEPATPVFSFREAQANPGAFLAWWKFFTYQVYLSNAAIHVVDPLGILPHVLKPNAFTPFYKGSIRINSLGYRGDDFPPEKGNTFRILTLGESTTFGQTLFPDAVPWSAVLQRLIDERLLCDRPVQVINGGVNAYVLRNGIERLRRDKDWLEPDMVLSYFGWNATHELDIDVSRWFPYEAIPQETLARDARRVDVLAWHLRQTFRKLWSQLAATYGGLNLLLFPPDEDALVQQAREGRYYQNYKALVDEASGRRLVFLSFNTAIRPDAPEEAARFYGAVWFNARQWSFMMRVHNAMLQRLANETPDRLSFVDTSSDLYGHYDQGLFMDIVHFTPEGDRRMGRNVLQGIEPLLRDEPSLKCRPR